MKKVLFFVAIATFSAGTMVSCGKSTKGKMDAEWSIDSYTEKSVSTDNGGNTVSTTIEITGTNRILTTVSGGGTTKKVGTRNDARWSIKKDGTWERTISYTTVDTVQVMLQEVVVTSNITSVESGTWDFLTGVGEFKKNERVSFSTLSSRVTTNKTQSGSSNTSTDIVTNTYLEGENIELYLIGESKKKSLSLTYSGSANNTQNSGGTIMTSKQADDKTYILSSN